MKIASCRSKAAFGSLTRWSETASRALDIDLRVGDYNLDNTHPVRGARPFQSASLDVAPVGNDEALRSVLWYWTDKRYKQALERLTVVKTNVKVNVKEEDTTGDFFPRQSREVRRTAGAARSGPRRVGRKGARLHGAVPSDSPRLRRQRLALGQCRNALVRQQRRARG